MRNPDAVLVKAGNYTKGIGFPFSWETLDSGLRPAGMTALAAQTLYPAYLKIRDAING